jgi:glycosyltransferase involved in cell wall biosynthesis
MHLAYLYSRYPVISQTFCDTEMLALERRGWSFEIGSIHAPLTSFRHGHAAALQAPIQYAPPPSILRLWEREAKRLGRWPAALVDAQTERYGPEAKASQRARNALYFAELFARHGVDHFHVHFANRAAQTALFVKAISGIPFSVTAHGQDFMVDLGSEGLLREIFSAAEFVAAETDYSAGVLRTRCPESAAKIHRVYNGMDLANFPTPAAHREGDSGPVRILSVGRLIPFKGFQHLIAACAELQKRGTRFQCEIIGDGPLRSELADQIAVSQLDGLVSLPGSLPQEEIFEKLRASDIFALPCIVDHAGASDVFPTVILEAMASARPVISTRVAGVPESVIDGVTGRLVEEGDVPGLASALEGLIADRLLRERLGAAGRARVEEHFQIEKTIVALENLLKKHAPVAAAIPSTSDANQIGYLVDRWPDGNASLLEVELTELQRGGLAITAFACEAPSEISANDAVARRAGAMEFLPDASVIEAAWQQNRPLARELEAQRTHGMERVSAALFLQQARFALALTESLRRKGISHLHATNSRALVCGVLLKRTLRMTLSATIESKPALSQNALLDLLKECEGARLADKRMAEKLGATFLFDARKVSGIRLTNRARFWQEWAALLVRWNRGAAI